MITIFHQFNHQILPINQAKKNCWIQMIQPTTEEIERVSEEHHIEKEMLEAALDLEESARIDIDEEQQTTLVIQDFPTNNTIVNKIDTYLTIPVGIILRKDLIITVCSKETPLFDQLKQKQVDLANKTHFLLQILYEISSMFVSKLNTLNKQRIKIETDAQSSLNDRHLYQLLEIEKSLIYFLTSLKSNSLVLEKISRLSSLSFDNELQDLLEDVIIETRQAIETSQLYKSILDSISNSYSSLISNRMNNIMKILTNITIILTLPTLVFSFYGMNVDLPFDESPVSWLIIILISLIFIFLFSWALWKNKFL